MRQAFAHALDRDAIMANIVKRQGIPAYSYLMPGFPASNAEAFKGTYPYDLEKAKQLLADAGYPNGEGFPKLTLSLRGEPALPESVAQAYASTLQGEPRHRRGSLEHAVQGLHGRTERRSPPRSSSA